MSNLSVTFAQTSYNNYIAAIEENADIDMSQIDSSNIFVAEMTNHIAMKLGKSPKRFYLILPCKDSGDLYASYFENDTYMMTELNFSAVEPLKDFNKDELHSFISKNGLSTPSEIKALIIHERMHMFAYNVICDDIIYIIPYHFTSESLFNVTGVEECSLEIGKAYSVDDFVSLCEKEQVVYDEYRKEKHEIEIADTPYISIDNDGEVVENEEKTDKKTPNTEDNKSEKTDNAILEEKIIENSKDDASEENADNSMEPGALEGNNEVVSQNVNFIDVPTTHWAYLEIASLAKDNVIRGYGNGYFGVDDSITYEHLSLLLDRLFNYKDINTQSKASIREDIIISLVKAMNADLSSIDISVVEQFSDYETISEKNKAYIAYAIECELVVGYNGNLYLENEVTRAETAVLLYRAMKLLK